VKIAPSQTVFCKKFTSEFFGCEKKFMENLKNYPFAKYLSRTINSTLYYAKKTQNKLFIYNKVGLPKAKFKFYFFMPSGILDHSYPPLHHAIPTIKAKRSFSPEEKDPLKLFLLLFVHHDNSYAVGVSLNASNTLSAVSFHFAITASFACEF